MTMNWFTIPTYFSVYNIAFVILLLTVCYLCLRRRKPRPTLSDAYDYIVVGAGSAGCVVASRLSEDQTKTVLLLEAGQSDDSNVKIKVPLAFMELFGTEFDWNFNIQPQEHACKAKTLEWPRGKCLGGSSSINAMGYCRGDSSDYNSWEKLGAVGWGWKDVLPYFLKSEDNTIPEHKGSPYHSTGGPLTVSDQSYHSQISLDLIKAGIELGYKEVDISSGENIVGFGKFPATIKNDARCSTSRAFLKPAKDRPNLTILTNAHVCKVALKDKTAVGVYFNLDTTTKYVSANMEVIVSAGTVCSPQILMLSGIGPKLHLEDNGIECVQDLPVGENLQDHYANEVSAKVESKDDVMIVKSVPKISNIIKYQLGLKSVFASNTIEATAFIRTGLDQDSDWPDLQMHLIPCFSTSSGIEEDAFPVDDAYLRRGWGYVMSPDEILQQAGVTFLPTLLHPKSRGSIKLRDSNPNTPPIIDPRYLEDPYDAKVIAEGIRLTKKLAETSVMKSKGLKLADLKMSSAALEFSDDNLDAYARYFGKTMYHPVGTCKMGSATDDTAVVDPQLRVRGIQRLRVVDGSIMPHVISGNTNASCIMIGEKGADLVKMSAVE